MALSHSNADPTGNLTAASSTSDATPRSLTYDEKKAAEAAFRGEPFNPTWSAGARRVYEGIVLAKGARALQTLAESTLEDECVAR